MWNVGGVRMEYPIMVGAGVCKTPTSIDPYQHPDLPIGAAIGGSYTPPAREGNSGKLSEWIHALRSGFNGYGMPNCGQVAAVVAFSEKILNRPFVANIAGFDPYDYVLGTVTFSSPFLRNIVSAIEWNLGCPNTGTLPVSYDLESLSDLLEHGQKLFDRIPPESRLPIWLKLSPYLTEEDCNFLSQFVDVSAVPVVDSAFTDKVANLIGKYTFVRAVSGPNTVPNCRYRGENGAWVTTPNDGKAGLSGTLLKEFALRQVRQLRKHLPETIDVIASGGILNGDDAVDFFEGGAQAIACTSLPYWHGGPKVFPALIEGSERLQNFLLAHETEE